MLARLKRYFASASCNAADDLAAETLLRLTKRLTVGETGVFEGDDSRTKFLFGIAKNVLAEWRRRPDAKETVLEDDGVQFVLPPVDLIGRQCLELLKKAVNESLAKLSEEDRYLILQTVLNAGYRRTFAELAEERGIQEPAMRQRSSRTRRRFEELLLASAQIDDLIRCLGLKRGVA